MAQMNAMRQIGARNMGVKIEAMEWSNKMDLIALGNEKGEVLVQRLNWQKIVTFPSPGENVKVKALTWQPDEPLIAAAYSNGKVALLDTEREEEIYSTDYDGDIKSLHWTKILPAEPVVEGCRSRSGHSHKVFLPPLPNLNALSSSAKKVDCTKNFIRRTNSFLVVCLDSGKVCLSFKGILPCGTLNLNDYNLQSPDFRVYDVQMSSNYHELFVFVKDGDNLKFLILTNEILSSYMSPLMNLAKKYCFILHAVNYLSETIQCIIEAWETVLMEMDNKLTKYANSLPGGSLSADFLELLIFGYPSPELEQFLTSDLTEKGLKKLANSTELSYTTIQNLVTKPLQAAAVHLFYHLNAVKGLSLNTFHYKSLLSPESAQEAITNCGAFLMKTVEMQQVIDQCTNDFKIFWCWLCVAIVRLMDENVSEEMSQVTQEDVMYLAEFLNNFDECVEETDDGKVIKKKFNLEKVGQYLEDKDLQQPVKSDMQHRWNKLLEENDCLRNSPLLFSHSKNLSLIQQRDLFKQSVDNLFSKPNTSIGESFMLKSASVCGAIAADTNFRMSYFCSESGAGDFLVATLSEMQIILIEVPVKSKTIRCTRITLTSGPFTTRKFDLWGDLTLVDLQFYNETLLSLLLLQSSKDDGKVQNYFVQFPIDSVKDRTTLHQVQPENDLSSALLEYSALNSLDSTCLKQIDGHCTSIAVSGSRKVTAILSENSKKVRIFEMEIEEDDEDADTTQNQILDLSREQMQT